MPTDTLSLHESIEIPQGTCFFRSQNETNGVVEIETILFGGDIFGEAHEGYIPYLASKIQGFEENIRSYPVRFQGLINCLTKGLIPYGQNKSDLQLQDNFEAFKQNLEFLYGYLGDTPELLEQNKKGSIKPQNISITKLLEKGKQLTAEKRSIAKGQEYTTALLAIISEELPDGAVKYIRKKYRVEKSPKATELIGLGISEEVATRIESEGTFHKIQAILSQEEAIIGEDRKYKMYEMYSIKHLEEESRVTDHCVGESDHYIRKMNNQTIRMFSLRFGDERITLEYDIKRNSFIQMKGNENRSITLEELDIIFSLISDTNLQQVGFNHEDVIELQSKENFVCGYHKFDTSLLVKDYIGIHSLKDFNVSGGKVICTEDTTIEEIEALCQFSVDLDITHTTAAVKNSIQNVKGSLIDHSSEAIQMNSLESVDGYFDCRSAKTISMNSLESIGGYFNCSRAENIDMNSLKSIGGYFNCSRAENIDMNSLKSIGGYFDCRRAENIDMNSLESVDGYFDCESAENISMNSLKSIGWYFNCESAENIDMNSLESVDGYFDCRSAKTISMNSLKSIGWYFNCESAENINMNSLESVDGYFDCRSAENIDMNSLESVDGYFDCESAENINMNSLESVGRYFDCRSAKTISMNSLESVGRYFDCRSAKTISMNSLESVGRYFDCSRSETGNLLNLKKCKKIIMKQENTIQLPEGHNFDITYM